MQKWFFFFNNINIFWCCLLLFIVLAIPFVFSSIVLYCLHYYNNIYKFRVFHFFFFFFFFLLLAYIQTYILTHTILWVCKICKVYNFNRIKNIYTYIYIYIRGPIFQKALSLIHLTRTRHLYCYCVFSRNLYTDMPTTQSILVKN